MNCSRSRSLFSRMESILDHCRRLHSKTNSNPSAKRPYTIAVEGNIGAGKTTFLEGIQKQAHPGLIEFVKEPVDEWRTYKDKFNLLDMMYEDPKKWSFLFQVQVQLSMMRKFKIPCTKPIRVMERSLLSARFCFVENLYNNGYLEDVELHILNDLYNFVIEHDCFVCKTDLIVYLRTSPEVAYQRMLKRSRSNAEKALSLEHFQKIHDLHEDWLYNKSKFQPLSCPVVVIDGNKDLEEMRLNYLNYEKVLLKDAPMIHE